MSSHCVFTASSLYFLALTKLISNSERRPLRWPSENLGWRRINDKDINIRGAGPGFGVGVPSAPPSAQTHYGKALNDGGMVDDYNSSATPAKPLYNSATPAAPATPHYGKALNDGGIIDEPSAAQRAAAKALTKTVQQQTPPHYGKPMNDGGF